MTVNKLINDSLELSIAERIQIVEGIWNTIADSKSNINFTSSEINSFEEELTNYRQNPSTGVSWENLKASLLSKYKK